MREPQMRDATVRESVMRDTTPGGGTRLEAAREGSYVDWPCVFAGAVVAVAVAFVLMTFGTGIGLSVVSPVERMGVSGTAFVLGATLWTLAVHLLAFGAGGYLAGRMRRPWHDASVDESEFRDGAHGGVVWAVGVVLMATLLTMTATGVLRTGAQALATADTSTARGENALAAAAVDTLFRSPNRPVEGVSPADQRAEASRLVTNALGRGGDMPAADRQYLAQIVAQRTGLPQGEAETRVTQALSEARHALDQARRAGILAAFLAAAAMLIGGAVAWSTARLGGQHRSQGIVWRGLGGRRVTPAE